MRIGIDARTINVYPGMGRYCTSLVRALAEIDHENEYVIFKIPEALEPITNSSNFTESTVDIRPLSIGTVMRFARYVKSANLDVILCAFYIAPWHMPCKMVLTVHDMMDRSFPQMFSHHAFPISSALSLFYRLVVGRAIRNSNRIIAVSHFTKTEVLRYYNFAAERIRVIHEAADEHFKPVTDTKTLKQTWQKYGLPSDYVLFVGTTKYYKNLGRLLQSFAYARRADLPIRPKLVIAGVKDVLGGSLSDLARTLNIVDDVLFIGGVDEEDLPGLYTGATAFALPSLYEGFGLTALEAMSCGTPVIASRTSALGELVGKGGMLVDPLDVSELTEALIKVCTDQQLQEKLSLKGLRQARKFSWKKAARETLNLLLACAE